MNMNFISCRNIAKHAIIRETLPFIENGEKKWVLFLVICITIEGGWSFSGGES